MRQHGLIALTIACWLAALPGVAQESHEHHHPEEEVLGHVHFPITCKPEVQPAFDRAMALLHSFGYETARQAFAALAEQDPACGMAKWGVAMTWYHPIWAPPTPAELAAGRSAAEEAARLGAHSEREQGYIAAIGAFYRDADKLDHRTRAAAYQAAMEKLAATFPEDDEAAILYALALLGTAPPNDTTYAQQKRAAEILNRLLPEHPDHPGILHYIIHSFDYPQLASLALPAARAYAKVASSSPHALHMPSHIFTRLGLWEESIASNLESAAAAKAQMARAHPGATAFDNLHALDYLEYAYLQLGADQKAREVLEEVAKASRFDEANFAAGYALVAVPARYALERRDWRAAAALASPAAELPWERFSYARGITSFANALGAARLGDLDRARKALAELEDLHTALTKEPPAGPYDWAGQVDAMRLAAAGWVAFAEGRKEEAVRLLTAGADKEEAVGKHPVTPGAILPARELLGDLLLELGKPREALAAYETSLAGAPKRFNSLAGAARAAELAGEPARARSLYEELLALCGPSCERPEAKRAKAFASGS
jgi:tetratricopeptide (TPR) repeat protein